MAANLAALFGTADEARVPLPATDAGGWHLTREEGKATLSGAGDPVVALRMLCAVTWDGVPTAAIHPASAEAAALLEEWGR